MLAASRTYVGEPRAWHETIGREQKRPHGSGMASGEPEVAREQIEEVEVMGFLLTNQYKASQNGARIAPTPSPP